MCQNIKTKIIKMNQSEQPLIQDKYIVEEAKMGEYIKKKNKLQIKRNLKAVLNILFTIFITLLYYADIISDSWLCYKYYQDGHYWWFRITISIVLISTVLNTSVLFYYSYLQEIKFNWKKKEYCSIIKTVLCLFFQLEMLRW